MPYQAGKALIYAVLLWAIGFVWGSIVFMTPALKSVPAIPSMMALPRYGSVEEVASMVAYLAGPEAGLIAGSSLTIDGGFTA